MDPTQENIKCRKGDETKFFSQRQLDNIGMAKDGSFDGWIPQGKKPVGIPEPVTVQTSTGAITVVNEPVGDDPNAITDPNTVTPVPVVPVTEPVVPVAPPVPVEVDPAKVEEVKKTAKKS